MKIDREEGTLFHGRFVYVHSIFSANKGVSMKKKMWPKVGRVIATSTVGN